MIDANFYKSQAYYPIIDKNLYSEEEFKKVAEKIIDVVGKKAQYTVSDAVRFFKTQYHAFQVPWDYLLDYIDGTTIGTFYENAHFNDDEISPFDYNGNGKHKNVTLVIDLINNRELRNEYPIIEQTEETRLKLQKAGQRILVCQNDFIVIGSFDNKRIESMFTHSNIDDINYAIAYFFLHS